MVPKAHKTGSFKAAANYYLHDKGASSTERVSFTLTENLPTNDAALGMKIMAHTAMNADYLKRQAGVSTRGRKQEKPVYAYSLAWHPDDRPPTRDDMIDAAKDTLKRLGLDRHEAIIVGHNDTKHPHVHVIVNRVNPETGVMAKLSNDRHIFSRWAQAHEQARGEIRCEQRVENNRRRDKGEYVKDRNNSAADYRRWRHRQLQTAFKDRAADRDALGAAHKAQHEALFAAKEQKIRQARQAITDRYENHWASLYLTHDQQWAKLRTNQYLAYRQIRDKLKNDPRAWLRTNRETRSGYLRYAFTTTARGEWADLKKRHREERQRLSTKIREAQKKALSLINEKYKADRDALREKQRIERQALDRRQSAQSQKAAKDLKSGAAKREFQKERTDRRRKELAEQEKRPTRALKRAVDNTPKPKEITTDSFRKAAEKAGPHEKAMLKKLEKEFAKRAKGDRSHDDDLSRKRKRPPDQDPDN